MLKSYTVQGVQLTLGCPPLKRSMHIDEIIRVLMGVVCDNRRVSRMAKKRKTTKFEEVLHDRNSLHKTKRI